MFAVREEDADDIGVGYRSDCVSVPFSEQNGGRQLNRQERVRYISQFPFV